MYTTYSTSDLASEKGGRITVVTSHTPSSQHAFGSPHKDTKPDELPPPHPAQVSLKATLQTISTTSYVHDSASHIRQLYALPKTYKPDSPLRPTVFVVSPLTHSLRTEKDEALVSFDAAPSLGYQPT